MPGLAELAKGLGQESEAPDMMGGDETEAGEEFLAAIRSGDPEEVVTAFKSLKRACETSYSAEAEEE